jgi:hypothetical protein
MWKLPTLAIAAALLLVSEPAIAKRFAAPKDVAPVTAKGVVYRVPHFGAFHDKHQNGGFVQAWDAKTKKLLWDRMVYRTIYERGETDVQDVFITKIRVVRDKLLVTNEAGERFEMDLPTGRVRALTPLNQGWQRGRREVPEPEAGR